MSGRVGVEQTPDIEAVASKFIAEADFGAIVEQVMAEEGWSCTRAEHDEEISRPGECADCDGARHIFGFRLYAALAPVLAAAVREARAAELREAADDLTQLAVIEFDARPNAPRGAAIWDSAQWLKDRADRIAVDAPECRCPDPLREVSAFCPLHGHSPEAANAPEGGEGR